MQSGRGKGFNAEINVTPLVDVVLVLLIIFMVVTPMLQESHSVELPEASEVEHEKTERERLYVVVDVSGTLYIDNQAMEFVNAEEFIRLRLEQQPGLEVLLKGDQRLAYESVRDVMSACRRAGAKRVVLATKERKEPG